MARPANGRPLTPTAAELNRAPSQRDEIWKLFT
jgi:hypothetical protein